VIGFCLAAGPGSRLAPLTRAVPKPLLAPAGRPLLELACAALEKAGAERVVVNVHHGASAIGAYLAGRPGIEVAREPVLLGTGGGLVAARRAGLLGDRGETVVVTCADHVVDPADLAMLAAALAHTGAPVVMGLGAGRMPPLFRLEGDRALPDPDGAWTAAGVYALRASVLDGVDPGYSELLHAVLEPCWCRGALLGAPMNGPWADAGTLGRFLAVSAGLLRGRWPYPLPPGRLLGGDQMGGLAAGGLAAGGLAAGGLAAGGLAAEGAIAEGRAGERPSAVAIGSGPVFLAAGAVLEPGALLAGPVVLDAGSRVEAGATVTRTIVGSGATVGRRATVTGSVLGPGARLSPGTLTTAALVPPG
jgi:mannose-1-phosphate guanylyltransferase